MAKTINVILCVIFIFILAFCWICFSVKNAGLALALSAIVTVASAYVLWQINSKREDGKQKRKTEKRKSEAFGEYLRFNADNGKLFADMLAYYGFETVKADYDSLTVSKEGKLCYVKLAYEREAACKESVRDAVVETKRSNADKLYYFCVKCDEPLKTLANAYVDAEFIDLQNARELFDQCGKLPETPRCKTVKTSAAAKYAFNRKRFGWYFCSGLFSVALSFISYLKYYLLAWATAFLFLSLYCLFNRRYNSVPTKITLK